MQPDRRSGWEAVFFVTVMLFTSTGVAVAHSYLRNASPPAGSTVTVAPREVIITFTSAVEPRFSTIEVTDATGQRKDAAEPGLVGGDATRLAVRLRSMPPGIYTVVWHATSVDTHKTDGSYKFTVADTTGSDIDLEHVWARPTTGLATTGAIYFTVTNKGQPDRLIGVTTPVAATAELHETTSDHGVMKMRSVLSIALDPGKPVAFKPGGYHVMLIGLKSPLKAGDSFPLTLTFEHAAPVTVTAKVEDGGTDRGHGGMEGMPGMRSN